MKRQSRGVMLMGALFCLSLIGVSLLLLSQHLIGTATATRRLALDARSAQVLASARAWMTVHADECLAMKAGQARSLDVSGIVPDEMGGSVVISRTSRGAKTFEIAARVGPAGRQSVLRAEIRL